MSQKPAYYNELEKRIDKIDDRQREFRDTIDTLLTSQAEQTKNLKEIHYLLAGTEYEKNNGGLVGDVKRLHEKVRLNTVWRIRIMAGATAITTLASIVIAWLGFIVKNLKNGG